MAQSPPQSPPQAPIFDPAIRAARRARARALLARTSNPLLHRLGEEMAERLTAIDRPRDRILLAGDYGQLDVSLFDATNVDRIEDDPLLAPASYDAIVILGWLDTQPDLAARARALVETLKPDRPFLMASLGGGTGRNFRSALLAVEGEDGAARARFHPALSPQSLAQLAQAAGLREPVVEVDRWSLRYSSTARWLADARELGLTNQLASRAPMPSRGLLSRIGKRLDPPFGEMAEILHLTGWKTAI